MNKKKDLAGSNLVNQFLSLIRRRQGLYKRYLISQDQDLLAEIEDIRDKIRQLKKTMNITP